MKIAAVTDDGKLISAHFGRATRYAVFTVEKNIISSSELRDKVGHRQFQNEGLEGHHHHSHDQRGRGYGQHSEDKHRRMFETIADCQIILARGMGRGAYDGFLQIGIKPIVTDIAEIETAVQAVIDGSIINYSDRLH